MGKGLGTWVPGPGQSTLLPTSQRSCSYLSCNRVGAMGEVPQRTASSAGSAPPSSPRRGRKAGQQWPFEGNNPGFYRAAWALHVAGGWGQGGGNEAQGAGPPRLEENMSALFPLSHCHLCVSAGLGTNNQTLWVSLVLTQTKAPQTLCNPDTRRGCSGPPCEFVPAGLSSFSPFIPSPHKHSIASSCLSLGREYAAIVHGASGPQSLDLISCATPPCITESKVQGD